MGACGWLDRRSWGLLTLVGILSLAGCSVLGRDPPPPGAEPPSVDLEVENWSWLDVRILVLREGHTSPQRLGLVTSMASRSFRIPPEVYRTSGRLYLVASPVGSFETHTTGTIHVSPGDRIRMRLQTKTEFSAVIIR